MRSGRQSKIEVSMFPFLSVLCSVIGVLMLLMVLVITTREMPEDVTPVTPVSLPPTKPDNSGITDELYERLRNQLDELSATLGERQQEVDELNRMIAQLEELVAAKEDEMIEAASRKDGLAKGVPLDKPEEVEFIPYKNEAISVHQRPRYIEVTATHYIAQPEGIRFQLKEVEMENSSLRNLLAKVNREHAKQYLVFLIHENGANAYGEIFRYVKKTHRRLKTGKEPFSKGWEFVRNQSSEE